MNAIRMPGAICVLTLPLVWLTGCGSAPDSDGDAADAPISGAKSDGGGDEHAHDHSELGLHGGQVADLGNGAYHAELVQNHEAGTVAIHLLDGSGQRTAPIDAAELTINLVHDGRPAQFKVPAAPTVDDPEGRSSRFVSDDERLAGSLGAQEYDVRLVVSIDGKSYTGRLSHSHGDHAHAHAGHAHSHGHAHGADDALVWRRDDLEHKGFQLKLGHHARHLHAGEAIEPAVSITRDGRPVPNAEVFNALLSADGETVVADEVSAVYEPPTADEPAHYAQGALKVPADLERAVLRYRIVLPDGAGEVTYDVPVEFEREHRHSG